MNRMSLLNGSYLDTHVGNFEFSTASFCPLSVVIDISRVEKGLQIMILYFV